MKGERKEIELETLSDLLLLVDINLSVDVIANWSPEQREQASNWAAKVHLRASDNIVRVPKKPEFLGRYADES